MRAVLAKDSPCRLDPIGNGKSLFLKKMRRRRDLRGLKVTMKMTGISNLIVGASR
jgi:hypothetical protein